ncbi:MAG: hypothetical protein JXB50_03165 [Spirochaetes bacterium]|nr:hypothetical protein [Spirochaetota bacterium]
MNTEILLQNIFNLFIISIILEFCEAAIFSINVLSDFSDSSIGKSVREGLIILVALIICYKVPMFRVFRRVIDLPYQLDWIISTLVLARMTFMIKGFLEKIKERG